MTMTIKFLRGDFLIKEIFEISGMSCSAYSVRIEKSVGKIVGADNISVNLLTNSMQVTY